MPNMKQAVTKHNNQAQAKRTPAQAQRSCNCTGGKPCPLDGNCLLEEVIYKATVVDQDGASSTYTGLTANSFKQRYNKHNSDFRNRSGEHATTLATHIWSLRDAGKDYDISWSVIDRGRKFNPTRRKCNLCLTEKYNIIFHPLGASLNKRSELFSVCKHRKQELLANV